MAGSPQPAEDTPKFGMKATIAAVVFVVAILAGFGAATAATYPGEPVDDHGDEYGEEHSDEYGDDHSDGDDHS